jgi:hypothetical protein
MYTTLAAQDVQDQKPVTSAPVWLAVRRQTTTNGRIWNECSTVWHNRGVLLLLLLNNLALWCNFFFGGGVGFNKIAFLHDGTSSSGGC